VLLVSWALQTCICHLGKCWGFLEISRQYMSPQMDSWPILNENDICCCEKTCVVIRSTQKPGSASQKGHFKKHLQSHFLGRHNITDFKSRGGEDSNLTNEITLKLPITKTCSISWREKDGFGDSPQDLFYLPALVYLLIRYECQYPQPHLQHSTQGDILSSFNLKM
jgi:hypothetical protein